MTKLALWDNGENLLDEKITIMDNIVTFAKNLILPKEEKLLREMGLKNDCGNYTQEAMKIVVEKIIEENKDFLVEIAEKAKAEKDSKK